MKELEEALEAEREAHSRVSRLSLLSITLCMT